MAESSLLARYDVLLELAAGGMAMVHLGRRNGAAGFDRLVVIKRIHRHLIANADIRAMFVDEALLTANVHHPHVVPIVDVLDEDGELALVMDYIESVSLAALIAAVKARGERLPLDVVSRIIGDTLRGLHAAHEAVNAEGTSLALVHRDVSPQNIIVGTDGIARLIDFGIAKATERIAITKDDSLKGKLRYMSPEQGRRESLDRRSDIFAAGLVLYEAIAGHPAIAGNDEATIWISLVLGELEPLPGLPPALTDVLAGALERRVDNRLPTASEFEERLHAAIPPATPAAVAACVEEYLGSKVGTMREVIRAARRGSPPSHAIATVTDPNTVLTVVDPRPERGSGASWRGWSFLAAAAAGLLALVVIGRRTREVQEIPAQPPTESSAGATLPPQGASALSAPIASVVTEEHPVPSTPARSAVPTSKRTQQRAPVRPTPGRKLHDDPYAGGR